MRLSNLKVDFLVICCEKVMLENFRYQMSRQGLYTQMSGVLQNDHPVYVNKDNSNYLWKSSYGWYVGSNYTISMIGIKSEESCSFLKI